MEQPHMKALVTGATGFVGSHLAARLVTAGLELTCLVRPSSDRRWLAGLPVSFCQAPLEDGQALSAAAAGMDYIFHVAGLTRARRLEDYLAVNQRGTAALLAAAARAGGQGRLKRFVYISSLAAAGPAPSAAPLDESCPPRPLEGYGRSKLAAERACLAMADRLAVTIIRPPAVYGPRDTNWLPLFRTAARLGIVPIIGRSTKQVSFVYVSDLVEGIWLAAQSPAAAGGTYFLGSGTHTLAELAAAVAAALGKRPRRLSIPGPLARLIGELGELKWLLTGKPQIISRRKVRDALQPRWTCTWQRAERDWGYRPRVDLVDGMRETARWYAANGWMG